MNYLIAILSLLLILSCKTMAPMPDPIKVEPGQETTIVLDWKQPGWDKALIAEIASRLSDFNKAKDMNLYCAKYDSLSSADKTIAWASLFVAVAKFESNYNPKSKMTESNGDVSQGLFQLTYGNSHCPKSKAHGDLDNPFINIGCAVNIAADYTAKDGTVAEGGYVQHGAKPSRGLARYWSVLRAPDLKSRHHLAEIKSKVSKLPLCN
jgi:hypothetical protein